MGRPKGGKNRNWSKEEKLRIVLRNLDDKVGQWTIAKEENINRGQVHSWIKKIWREDPMHSKTGRRPAINLQHCRQANLLPKNNG